jgi:hypothetical protein
MTPTDDEAEALIDAAFSESVSAVAEVMDPIILHHPHRFNDGTVAPLHIELKVLPSEDLPLESIPSVVSVIGPLASAVAEGRFDEVTGNSFTCPIMISSPATPDELLCMRVQVAFGVHDDPAADWELTSGIILGYIINATFVELRNDAMHSIDELTTQASITTLSAIEPVLTTLHRQLAVTTELLSTRFEKMTLRERNSWQEAALVTATLGQHMEHALANVARNITTQNEAFLNDERVHNGGD